MISPSKDVVDPLLAHMAACPSCFEDVKAHAVGILDLVDRATFANLVELADYQIAKISTEGDKIAAMAELTFTDGHLLVIVADMLIRLAAVDLAVEILSGDEEPDEEPEPKGQFPLGV